jgi:hypothetical protein
MESEWVDFKSIKAEVTIEMVLDHYGISGLKKNGPELRGICPIHRGTNKKQFTANLNKNVFKCFFAQCGAYGNVLDFVAAMEQCSVREAGLKLKDWFGIGERGAESPNKSDDIEVRQGIYKDKNGALYEVIGSATSAEDFEPVVVYRELFDDYRLWVAPGSAFSNTKPSEQGAFSLIKEL